MHVPVTANCELPGILHCCRIPSILLFCAPGDHLILGIGLDEASNQASLNPGAIDLIGSQMYFETTSRMEVELN